MFCGQLCCHVQILVMVLLNVIDIFLQRSWQIPWWAIQKIYLPYRSDICIVLKQCKYLRWTIQKILREQEQKKNKKGKERNTRAIEKRCHIVVPYIKGLCESYKSICSKYGVQAYFKGGNTLKSLLMFPKDKEEIKKQSNIIYWYKCGRTECDDEYTRESARTFEERYK